MVIEVKKLSRASSSEGFLTTLINTARCLYDVLQETLHHTASAIATVLLYTEVKNGNINLNP